MKWTTFIMVVAMFIIAAWSLSAQEIIWTDFINVFMTDFDYFEYCFNVEVVDDNIYIMPTTDYYYPHYTSLIQIHRSNSQVGWRRDWVTSGGYMYPGQLVTSPDGQLMFVEDRFNIRKVDASTGESIWFQPWPITNDGQLHNGPNDTVIDIDECGYIKSISPVNGEMLWRSVCGDNIVDLIAYGAVGEQNQNLLSVFVQSTFRDPHETKISLVDIDTANYHPTSNLIWQTTIQYNGVPMSQRFPVLYYNGTLYSVTGTLWQDPDEFWLNKFNPNNGEVMWSHHLDINYDIQGLIEDRMGGVLVYGQDTNQQKPKIQNYNGNGDLMWSFMPNVSAEYLPANFGDACWYNNHLMLSGAAGPYTGLWELAIPGNAVEDTTIPAINNVSCYPNPFRGDTTIKFKQTVNSQITITVYNIKGQLIKTLTNQPFNSGEHHVTWDGKDDQGRSASPGIYFYKVKSGKFCTSGKMILMK